MDGGYCTEGHREALCAVRGCRDMLLPKKSGLGYEAVKVGDDIQSHGSCDKLEKTECDKTVIKLTYCRKTCGACNAPTPWTLDPADSDAAASVNLFVRSGPDEIPP